MGKDRATGSHRDFYGSQRKRGYWNYNGDLPLVLDVVIVAQEQSLLMLLTWL